MLKCWLHKQSLLSDAISKNLQIEENKVAPKVQYTIFLNDPNCKDMYADGVKSKYNKLNEARNLKQNLLRTALLTSASEIIPK